MSVGRAHSVAHLMLLLHVLFDRASFCNRTELYLSSLTQSHHVFFSQIPEVESIHLALFLCSHPDRLKLLNMKMYYLCLQVSYVVSAMLVLVTLYIIAPLFEALPLCVLASIIVVSSVPLCVHYMMWRTYWRTDRYDFAIWVVSCCGTFLAGIDYGMIVGVAFSVLVVHFRMQVNSVL